MSIAAKRLRRHGSEGAVAVTTSTAGWGKGSTFNFGAGYRRVSRAEEVSPFGMPLTNATQVAFGYGEGAALKPDGSVEVWGQNLGANLPWTTGPEGLFCGQWGYRTNLIPQVELEEGGMSSAEREAKERKLEFPPRANDGRKGIVGQLIYGPGAQVFYEGFIWEALVENCAVRPGTDLTVWVLASPQVPQFKKPLAGGGEAFLAYAFNLNMPRRAVQLTNVSAVSMGATHGAAVLRDGSARCWGHLLRYGGFGTGMDQSFGAKPRPLKPPFPNTTAFGVTAKAGSRILTALEHVGEKSHKAEAAGITYGKARSKGAFVLQLAQTGLTGVAATDVLTLAKHKLVDGDAIELTGLVGGAGLTNGVRFIRDSTPETFKLALTEGGAAINFTTDVTAGSIMPLGLVPGSIIAALPGAKTGITGVAATDVITKVAHGLEDRMAVEASALSGGAGIPAGPLYVIEAEADTFKLSASLEGSAVNFTTDITAGTITPIDSVEVLDEEGHKFAKERRRLLQMRLDEPATRDYTGVVYWKKKNEEEKFWKIGEGVLQSAGWPVKPKLPLGVTLTAIATNGDGHYGYTIALTSTGEVLGWGASGHGQMGDNGPTAETNYNLFPDYILDEHGAHLKGITAIAAAETFCIAINTAHEVLVWGSVNTGQGGAAPLEAKVSKSSTVLTIPGFPSEAGRKPVACAGARETGYVILENGELWSWGNNEHGELGTGTVSGKFNKTTNPEPWSTAPARVGTFKAKFVAGGRYHAAAVTTAGDVYAWGENEFGQLGIGSAGHFGGTKSTGTPTKVELGGLKAIMLALGEFTTLALLEGSSAPQSPIKIKLVPQGEVTGEPSAFLKIRWESALGTGAGWRLNANRQTNWWEEVQAEELRRELEEAIEEGGLSTQEREEAEEELEVLELEEEERIAGGESKTIVPTEPSPGVLEYEWISPGRLTPNSGYIVGLACTGHEGAGEWKKITIFTNGLWESPYSV